MVAAIAGARRARGLARQRRAETMVDDDLAASARAAISAAAHPHSAQRMSPIERGAVAHHDWRPISSQSIGGADAAHQPRWLECLGID
jgi:hypothetical protein